MKNDGRKLGDCICDNCGVEFKKPQSEINRSKKLERQNFCSRTCVGLNNVKNFGNKRNNYDISKHSGWKKDEFTKFRYHFRNIKKRNKVIDITLEDLRDVWNKQQEMCPYLGIKLTLNSYGKIEKDPITSASLDRIDSSKGYIKGNIQWISRAINFMKNDMHENELLKIFDLIVEKRKGFN
jgi:hypothetical protein